MSMTWRRGQSPANGAKETDCLGDVHFRTMNVHCPRWIVYQREEAWEKAVNFKNTRVCSIRIQLINQLCTMQRVCNTSNFFVLLFQLIFASFSNSLSCHCMHGEGEASCLTWCCENLKLLVIRREGRTLSDRLTRWSREISSKQTKRKTQGQTPDHDSHERSINAKLQKKKSWSAKARLHNNNHRNYEFKGANIVVKRRSARPHSPSGPVTKIMRLASWRGRTRIEQVRMPADSRGRSTGHTRGQSRDIDHAMILNMLNSRAKGHVRTFSYLLTQNCGIAGKMSKISIWKLLNDQIGVFIRSIHPKIKSASHSPFWKLESSKIKTKQTDERKLFSVTLAKPHWHSTIHLFPSAILLPVYFLQGWPDS